MWLFFFLIALIVIVCRLVIMKCCKMLVKLVNGFELIENYLFNCKLYKSKQISHVAGPLSIDYQLYDGYYVISPILTQPIIFPMLGQWFPLWEREWAVQCGLVDVTNSQLFEFLVLEHASFQIHYQKFLKIFSFGNSDELWDQMQMWRSANLIYFDVRQNTNGTKYA